MKGRKESRNDISHNKRHGVTYTNWRLCHVGTKVTHLVLIEREIGLQRPDEEWLGVRDFWFRHLLLVLGPVGPLSFLHLVEKVNIR